MRLIDADKFFEDFPEIRDYEYASQSYEVEAEHVKTGKWIEQPNMFWTGHHKSGLQTMQMNCCFDPELFLKSTEGLNIIYKQGYECSECGAIFATESNYCPNCGAKMEGAEE